MKVLVTGANGFVGNFLCNELLKQEYEILKVARSHNLKEYEPQFYFVDSIDSKTNWGTLLNNVDVVIHLAARVHVMNDSSTNPLDEFRKVNVRGTLTLARAAANSRVKRFIYISSVKVNGEYTNSGEFFTELNKANPLDPYGMSKLEAEKGLMEISQHTGMEMVIIRPPLVYGKGVKANFAKLILYVEKGILLPFGSIKNKRSLIYVENLVSLILICIKHPAAANQIFLVSDGLDLSTTELLTLCAKVLGVKSRLLPIPEALIVFIFNIFGKNDIAQRLCSNLQVDNSKARQMLGWKPPFTVEEGFKKTVS